MSRCHTAIPENQVRTAQVIDHHSTEQHKLKNIAFYSLLYQANCNTCQLYEHQSEYVDTLVFQSFILDLQWGFLCFHFFFFFPRRALSSLSSCA